MASVSPDPADQPHHHRQHQQHSDDDSKLAVDIPPEFVEHTAIPQAPRSIAPDVIAERRSEWIQAWTEIMREANGLLDELSREVVEVDLGADKGIYFRLRAGPLPDRAAAKRLCTALEAAGIGCFVARPSKAQASTAAEPGANRATLGASPAPATGLAKL